MAKTIKKAAAKAVPRPKVKKVKEMASIWDVIKNEYMADIDLNATVKSRTAKPYDIRVLVRMSDGKNPSAYDINLTNFFLRNPNLNFGKVAFLSPKPARKSGRKPNNPSKPEFYAIFDSSLHTVGNVDIRSSGAARTINSKIHALQLMKMFGKQINLKAGATTELFLKLTPAIEGEDRSTRKVCKITQLIGSEGLQQDRKK